MYNVMYIYNTKGWLGRRVTTYHRLLLYTLNTFELHETVHCKGKSGKKTRSEGALEQIATVGSQLSERSIIRTLGHRHVFGSRRKKCSRHWSSATGESKAAV